MTATFVLKELRVFLRNRIVLALSAMTVVLVIAAASLGLERSERFAAERAAAAQVDRQVWDAQGERNPHSAAHFSRYAFKPIPAFSAFDPGVIDYAGLAVWMEAHYQNPAVFRRAEGFGESFRLANLSPAWILQVVAPLLIFIALFASVAGEREDGTLRQTLAAGARGGQMIAGKIVGACLGLGAVLVPAVVIAAIAAASAGQGAPLPDAGVRTAGLAIVYTAYFAIIALVAIGVSAMCGRRRSAFLALMAIWIVSVVLVPRFGADAASALHPHPDVQALRAELSAASAAYWEDEAYQEKEKQAVLAQYGVKTVEELPFNYAGFRLQRSEEHAHVLFEAFYGRLDGLYAAQESLLRLASFASPTLATAQLSAGLSGVDRRHHRAFTGAAEAHRRKIIKELNDDMTNNAGEAGYGYTADASLWREIEDFSFTPPTFASLYRSYAVGALVLAGYFVISLIFALWAMARAEKRSVSS